MSNYTFDSDGLKYLLNKLKELFILKPGADIKVDKVNGKDLVTNDYTDEYVQLNNKTINDITVSNKTDTEITLTFNNKNGDSTSIRIPYDKHKKSALFVDAPEKFMCLANEENKINYRYISSLKDGNHSLVVEIVKSTGVNVNYQESYTYDEIPDYYSYVPDGEDIALRMYFIDSENTMTGITYLEPDAAYLVAEYILNEINDNAYPNCNDGSITNFAANDIKNNDNTFTRTAFTKEETPTKVDFRNTVGLTKINRIGSTITNMENAFYDCFNLTGNPICGPNVTNMSYAYYYCTNLIGSPVCGPNVTDMCSAYYSCVRLTGSPVCGNNVINMSSTYMFCRNLKGSPVCGPNVTTMYQAYLDCRNITGSPVCGNKVINMAKTYDSCCSLTGSPVCGNNVTNMSYAYYYCTNLTGSPVCGPNVTDMCSAYYNCVSLTGSPVCGNNVINMASTYANCHTLTGSPVCGPNVTTMYQAYYGCNGLCGNAYFESNKIQNAYKCFANRDNSKRLNLYTYVGNSLNTLIQNNATNSITGQDVDWYSSTACGYYSNDVANIRIYGVLDGEMEIAKKEENAKLVYIDANMQNSHSVNINGGYTTNIRNLSGRGNYYVYSLYSNNAPTNISFANNLREILYIDDSNLTNLSNAFSGCTSFIGPAICGPNVTNMAYAYEWCIDLTGNAACGDNVINMAYAYNGTEITRAVCGNNVVNMDHAYAASWYLKDPVCGPNVVNMSHAYYECSRLTGNPVCGPNVNIMYGTYKNCFNLTGTPVCGNNVTNMEGAYENCYNLTGAPACGPNVKYMTNAYYNCRNLTGSPVCGPNVKHMANAYYNCSKLTGQPVCGSLTSSMYRTYYNCRNLTGQPVCGSLATSMYQTYCGCPNIYGNFYCFSPYITTAKECFNARNTSNRLNIYVANYGNSLNIFLNENITNNTSLTWNETKIYNKTCFYNDQFNIYVYPELSVQLKKEKENNPNMYPYMIYEYYIDDKPESNSIYPTSVTATPSYSAVNILTQTSYDSYFKEVILYSNTGTGNLSQISFAYNGYQSWRSPGIVNILYWDTTNITNMHRSFYNCSTLKSQPMCGDNVTDMSYAYYGCDNSIGSPVCGPNVTNMYSTYSGCNNLTGNPACGNKVITMFSTYESCHNLTGKPVCGPNVTDMYWTYYACYKLTGSPVCGPNVTRMDSTYAACSNLTGSPVCGNKVTTMFQAYSGCDKLTGSPVCGPNVTNMAHAYRDCINLTGSPACGDKAIDLDNAYKNCYALNGPVYISRNNTDISMISTFESCVSLTGPVYIGTTNNKTVRLYNAFKNCVSLLGNFYLDSYSADASGCFTNKNKSTMLNVYVPDSSFTFYNCTRNDTASLIGSNITWTNDTANNRYYNTTHNIYIYPVANVADAYRKNELSIVSYETTNPNNEQPMLARDINAFENYEYIPLNTEGIEREITNIDDTTYNVSIYKTDKSLEVGMVIFGEDTDLTKLHSIGNCIQDIVCAYCFNLKGKPLYANNSTSYLYCFNLTGPPVCGPNVTNMCQAYYNCVYLTGSPVCGPNVTCMDSAYCGCKYLSSNGYFYSNKITNVRNCFASRDTSKMLNLYVPLNSTTLTTCLNTSASYSLTGVNMTWTNDMANNRYYNTAQNIYIYPVANVEQAYRNNG